MKLTNKQKTDLETILYFIPEVCNNIKITDKDIERFFEYSDQWKHKDKINQRMFLYPEERIIKIRDNWWLKTVPAFLSEWVGTVVFESWQSLEEFNDWRWFNALCEAKRWRGIHMEQYEQWILDGSTPYFILLWGLSKKRKWYQFWKPKFYNDPIPRSVVDFMKKEMFKWHDAELIERVYKLLSE